ncbi:hypothetical protein LMES_0033 [Leuconostoc mesenteroides KFRI-MG]|mgnify:FL=1|nr:hypothetical protein [Leuconostoc mesenteroides]ABJ61205.1 hypothetical protein LEUM_0052 [Leuconostoc mesenteroides subsp. mesenteroides ATCC 8293]AHF18249.1 hypothetical protein LMES_0033 [Leuconostoc mesenteroides KFRI-MG]GEA91623.1 hypothetical protein LME01_13590 [Leuconostoc mesenteroides subsp. mesenteroides]GEK65822.1 hypothetical protein LME04_09330 [Leuconostoc mesenteroides subsp. sake]GLX33785.1 hypothetical protein Lmede01_17630 [Leuconostoc mesenteroides subsp. dextranicum]
MGIMLIAAGAATYADQTRHLNTWLSTQSASRRQFFISKVVWMIIAPIILGAAIDLFMSITIRSDNLHKVASNNLNDGVELFYVASVVVLVSTIVGPIWQKIVGSFFALVVCSSLSVGVNTISIDFGMKELVQNAEFTTLVTFIVALLLLGASYYIVGIIGIESEHDAVRVPALRWPVVIFVFISTLFLPLNESPLTASSFVLPVVLSVITFIFVFKPKLSWQK